MRACLRGMRGIRAYGRRREVPYGKLFRRGERMKEGRRRVGPETGRSIHIERERKRERARSAWALRVSDARAASIRYDPDMGLFRMHLRKSEVMLLRNTI